MMDLLLTVHFVNIYDPKTSNKDSLIACNFLKNLFSALRPESANFPAAAQNEVAAFRRRRAEK